MALPTAAEFTDYGITKSQFRTALSSLRSYLSELLGDDGTVATALSTLGAGTLGITQSIKTDDYTCVLADSGKHILINVASKTITIPANSSVAYPIGTVITIVTDSVASSVAITTDTMTLAGTATTGTRALAANAIATVLKIDTTRWIIAGFGVT